MKKKDEKIYIYGKHSLVEALTHKPKAVRKVFLDKNIDDKKLLKLIEDAGLKINPIKDGGGVKKSAVHQGVIAIISTKELLIPYKDFVKDLNVTPATSLCLLAEIQDPHNVGAIIRSAAAFGVSAILLPERNQAGITGAVIKVSAGMAFRIPIVQISNINTTINDLKDKGFFAYGLLGEGKTDITKEKFDNPSLFIFGNEASGLKQKTHEACDTLLSIPMNKRAESLNVAASAAVTLYSWSTQHPEALRR